ncbi:MAG: hypothetical protein NTX25_12690 [Proteobacteria bacterium]|nr:hypothetical protein [Pseudomonadota bacterium]
MQRFGQFMLLGYLTNIVMGTVSINYDFWNELSFLQSMRLGFRQFISNMWT